jgi:multiple sugar transport system substrate-binding protein
MACTPSAGTAGQARIRVLVSGEPRELEAFRDVAEAFHARHPTTDVTLIETADRDELLARLSTSIAGGAAPDLVLINYRYFAQFASRGVFEPLNMRLASSARIELADYYRVALDAFLLGDEQMCLPQNISSLVVYYNRDLLREAGLDDPVDGWTWSDMVEMAGRLTADVDADGVPDRYGLGVDPEMIRLAPFVWSNGGEIVDDLEHPTGLELDQPAARQAMQLFFDLRRLYGVVPGEEELESEDNESRFLNGRTAMLLESRKVVPSLRTITAFDWDVVSLPVLREPATILHSDGYCMMEASTEKDAAWDYLEFAVGPAGQRITATTGRTVPSMRDVAESPAFLTPGAKPEHSSVFLESIPVIRRVPNIATWPEIEDLVNPLLEEGMFEGESAREIAGAIVARTGPVFARATT